MEEGGVVGQTISHYKVLDKLGEGGMGVVYKAEDTRLHRLVALKILRAEACEDRQLKARLSKEAEIAAALDHPNITTVYEIDEADGQTFLAMPLVEGETLAEKVRRRPLPLAEALEIALQIADGLDAAHRKGVVHRDIKPGNVMITNEGRVKIMDFGLAHLAGQTHITKTGTVLGTPAYMSPEQARGEAADARSDVWSLGVVIYEMMTGRQPFRGENGQSVMYSIINDDYEPITALRVGLPPELDRIAAKAMAKEPAQRFQHVDDLMVDLRALSKGPRAPSRTSAVGRPSRRGLFWAIVGFSLVVLAVAFGLDPSRLWKRLVGGGDGRIDSIVVLPLRNLSGDPEQNYFAAGMTEALFTDLAKIGALKVLSPRAAKRFEGTDALLGQIATELGVKGLVQGSAMRIGDRVRITAQLIDAGTDMILWAERYERDFQDVLVLQSELARAIARKVQAELTADEALRLASSGPVNTEAYEAYLRGKSHWYEVTAGGLDSAQQYFELALKKDPNSALGYAGLAEVWSGRQQMGLVPPREAAPKVVAAAEKALQLDSTLAEVHYTLAVAKTWSEWDWEGAKAGFRRAIELNPNYADAHAYYSHFLMIMKRPDEAMAQIERALELDPFNSLFQALYGMDLNFARRYDDAIAQLRETLSTDPNHPIAQSTLRVSYHHKGMYEEAYEEWKAAYAAKGDQETVEAMSRGYLENGYHGAMLRAAETLAARSRITYTRPWQIATLYVRAGEYHQSVKWFEKAYAERDPNMPYLSVDPLFDGLHDIPRYQDLLRRMNLPG